MIFLKLIMLDYYLFSDSTSKQTAVHLFAVNYNILKIMNGGGLVYSN